jgi:VWFA-related protein
MTARPPKVIRCLFLALACAFAWTSGSQIAQADGELTVSIAAIDDSTFPVVTAVFTVDDGGRPVTSIPAESLKATEGGADATVLSIANAPESQIPLALLITIDTSGSMAGANLAQSQAAATSLIRSLAPGDSAAVIAFADSVRVAAPLSQNPDDLLPAVASFRAEGNTALYDAVGQSAKLAAASGIGRRAVVLLSDGQDFGGRSALNREQALAQAGSGSTLFYVIGVGSQTDRQFLEDVAARSGGRFFEAESAADIPGVFNSIQAVLRSQFVATIRSSAASGPRSRDLTLSVAIDGKTGSQARTYETRRPPVVEQATAVPEPTPSPPPPAATAEAPRPADAESGRSIVGPLVLFLIVAAGAGVVLLLLWRRRRDTPALVPSEPALPIPERTSVPRPDAAGRIVVTRGPVTVETIEVDGGPITVGSAPACAVRLPATPGVAFEHARLWWRDGSPMVHALGRGNLTLLNGEPVEWSSLGDGDELTVGPFVLKYTRTNGTGRALQ